MQFWRSCLVVEIQAASRHLHQVRVQQLRRRISGPHSSCAYFSVGSELHRFYAKKFKSGAIQLVTLGGCGVWALIDLILLLTSKFTSVNGEVYRNPKPKVAWGIAVVVLVIGLASRTSDNGSKSSPSRSGSSRTISASEVAGHWVGEYQGLTAIDITLFPNGTYVSSSGDFAGGQVSQGSWRLSGNQVTVQISDGSPLSFTYSGGRLIAGNGRRWTDVDSAGPNEMLESAERRKSK